MRGVKRGQASTGRMKKHRDSHEFTVTAVKMANAPDVETKAVAEAVNIHPFMLSRWRKQVRDGALRGKTPKIELNRQLAVELRQLADLQQRYALLKQEHELLKKAIRFCSEARRRSLPSSTLRVASSR